MKRDANRIVKELREYAAGELLIHHFELMPRIDEAADLIESLQAQLEERDSLLKRWCSNEDQYQQTVSQLDCAKIEIESLRKELAESQRREKAAVEDIKEMLYRTTDCMFCADRRDGRVFFGPCGADICRDRAKWRGPQDGEED